MCSCVSTYAPLRAHTHTHTLPLSLSQEQYTFVHKAVLEKLTCRPTRMEVAQLDATLAELQTHDPRLGHSQLEEQFHQLEQLSPRPEQETMCRTALQHPHKNRSRDYLPCEPSSFAYTHTHQVCMCILGSVYVSMCIHEGYVCVCVCVYVCVLGTMVYILPPAQLS